MKDDMKNKGSSEDELFEAVTRSLKLIGVNLRQKSEKDGTCKSPKHEHEKICIHWRSV